jgi:hypothetical protein
VAYVVKAFEGATIAVCTGTETPGKPADMGITIFRER